MTAYNMPSRPALLTTSDPERSLAQTFAEGLRREMSSQRINCVDLSRLSGISVRRLRNIRNGRGRIYVSDIGRVADALDVKPSSLISFKRYGEAA